MNGKPLTLAYRDALERVPDGVPDCDVQDCDVQDCDAPVQGYDEPEPGYDVPAGWMDGWPDRDSGGAACRS